MPICGNVQRDEKTILIFFFSPYTAHIQHTEYFSLIGLIKFLYLETFFYSIKSRNIIFQIAIFFFIFWKLFLNIQFQKMLDVDLR